MWFQKIAEVQEVTQDEDEKGSWELAWQRRENS